MNEWRWWLWKWALATQERDFHSWGLKNFAETALSADSFQSFMHNKMHFFITSLTALIFPFRRLSLHSRVHDGYQGEEEDLAGGGWEADQVDQDHDHEGGGDVGHGGRVDLEI